MHPHRLPDGRLITPPSSRSRSSEVEHSDGDTENCIRHAFSGVSGIHEHLASIRRQQLAAEILRLNTSHLRAASPESGALKPEFHPSLTVSEDRSGNERHDPNFLALKERNAPNISPVHSNSSINTGPSDTQQQQHQYWTQRQALQEAQALAEQQHRHWTQPQALQELQALAGQQAPVLARQQQLKAFQAGHTQAQMHPQASGAPQEPTQADCDASNRPNDHQLQDYQMQLMLLEQQNRQRCLMRQKEKEYFDRLPKASSILPPGSPVYEPPRWTVPLADQYARAREARAGHHHPALARQVTGVDDNKPVQRPGADFDDGKSLPRGLYNLPNGDPSNPDIQRLQEFIQQLQARIQELQESSKNQEPSRYQLLYRILDRKTRTGYKGVYFDHPRWIRGDMDQSSMQSDLHVDNLDLYLERNKDISFIVFRDFDPDLEQTHLKPHQSIPANVLDAPAPPKSTAEFVRPVARSLSQALETIMGSSDMAGNVQRFFQDRLEFKAPFVFVHHKRHVLDKLRTRMPKAASGQLSLFLEYLDTHYGTCYAEVDGLLSRNCISPEYVDFLFKPEDLLGSRTDGDSVGHVLKSWPSYLGKEPPSKSGKAQKTSHEAQSGEGRSVHVWTMETWNWEFDGGFVRADHRLTLELPSKGTGEIAITELDVFPLRFAPQSIVTQLQRRGRTVWNCRKRRFVSYTEHDKAVERYMVDMETYKKFHSKSNPKRKADDIDAETLERREPPMDPFRYLVPSKIKGYNLRLEQWVDLSVDRISDVVWNHEAFRTLVIESKIKDLIRALVSKQLAAERSTDLIAGKGSGLIMLLHGGPGTGKTLTAESVAEIAEKPLYRVTCGNLGTKAEDIEKHLESVLSLGRTWDCVVLLDDADVFLEQRSLRDFTRNALVSVFLRALEYYDGILILTSNRVGTFDEAFRSRIQLALHYPALGPYERRRIWENFINRLESLGAVDDKDLPDGGYHSPGSAAGGVDAHDLRAHLDELAEERMNGRQIRNAITTARVSAEWSRRVLTYPLLKETIEIAGRFDRYLDRLNGMKGDEIAADEGLRAVEREEDRV